MNRHGNNQPPMLVYGRNKDGSLTHVENARNGLACGLVCHNCEDPLIARQGKKNEWHFAHCTNECGAGGGEGAFHKMLVDALVSLSPSGGPLPVPSGYGSSPVYRHPMALATLDACRIGGTGSDQWNELTPAFCRYIKKGDKRVGFTPDVVAMVRPSRRTFWSNDRQEEVDYADKEQELLVEVFVTHKCGEEKVARIRESGVAAVEYDLSREYREFAAAGRNITINDARSFFATVPEPDGDAPNFFYYPIRSKFLHLPPEVAAARQKSRQIRHRERHAVNPFWPFFDRAMPGSIVR